MRRAANLTDCEAAIAHGTGNVFADFFHPDADEHQKSLRLVHAINGVLPRLNLFQCL